MILRSRNKEGFGPVKYDFPVGGWDLAPGDEIVRTALHQKYGGRPQGGIGPSRLSPNVLLFTDPVAGERHGYFDGWQSDGVFHFTGEGQFGDQRLVSGNASILHHRADGRALRLFQGARGIVRYVDEFHLESSAPWYETDAPESGGGPVRKVIVFRLRPLTVQPQPPQSALARVLGQLVEWVPVEEQFTEKTFVEPGREPYEAERREATLVRDFRDWLVGRGHRTERMKILPPGEGKPIFCDLVDRTAQVLVEAKGSVSREAIRMAIGQLADYARFGDGAVRALLVPEMPRADLVDLCRTQEVGLIWPGSDGFLCDPPDLLGAHR
jgi:hypothetical protein